MEMESFQCTISIFIDQYPCVITWHSFIVNVIANISLLKRIVSFLLFINQFSLPLSSLSAPSDFGSLLQGKALGADLGFDSAQRRELLQALAAEFCVPVPAEADSLLDYTSIVDYFAGHAKAR